MREWQIGGGEPCPGCGQIMEKREGYNVCWNVCCDVIRTTPVAPEILLRQHKEILGFGIEERNVET